MAVVWIYFLAVAALHAGGGDCLSDIHFRVLPPVLERGKEARLMCDYVMDPGDSLYIVKFYRGQREFYRFTPSEKGMPPRTSVFPIPGVNVDLSRSNATQVTLTNVDFIMTGNASCEVTIDRPSFKMLQAGASTVVIALPRSLPKLWTQHERYEIGDQLIANCTVPPATPPAKLSFQVNNMTVPSGDTVYIETADRELWSTLSINMPLDQRHFRAGRLALRCTARLTAGFAVKSEPLQLGVRPSEPVPERVTSSSRRQAQAARVCLLVVLLAAFIRQ